MPLWHSFRECDREQYSHTMHAVCCDDMFPNDCMYRNGENVLQPDLVGYVERLNDIEWDSAAVQKFEAAVEESDQFFFCGGDVRHTVFVKKTLPVSVSLNGQAVSVLLPFSLLSRTVCHPFFFLRSNRSIFESV